MWLHPLIETLPTAAGNVGARGNYARNKQSRALAATDIYQRGMDAPAAAITRRTLLRGAAGGAAVLASAPLPAWARPVAGAAGYPQAGRRHPQARQPAVPAPAGRPPQHAPDRAHRRADDGEPLLRQPTGDGRPRRRAARASTGSHAAAGGCQLQPRRQWQPVVRPHARRPCQRQRACPAQSWNATTCRGTTAQRRLRTRQRPESRCASGIEHDLPFTYSLARHFPIGQRYFCSALAQTYPNRRFMFSGTASGTIATDSSDVLDPAANGTIWDRLDAHTSTGRLLPEPAQLAHRARLFHRARAHRVSASSTAVLRRRRGRAPPRSSRSSTRTTPPPRRRTPRTSRSASGSSPRWSDA